MKTVRDIVKIIFLCVFVVGFICMIFTDLSSPNWFKHLFTYFLLVMIGFLGAYIAENPVRLTKHVAATISVISAFLYRRFKLCNDIGYKSNIIRHDLGGYVYLYTFVEDKFEDTYDSISNMDNILDSFDTED